MFRPFAEWLAATPLSVAFQNALWLVPTSQSIHILALAAVFTAAVMINLRVLGIGGRGNDGRSRSLPQLIATLVPWIWRGLVVLLITGTVQTITEPVRQFVAPVFWVKMTLIVAMAIWTAWLSRSSGRPGLRPGMRLGALISTAAWVSIIVCGRMIGYTYANHL